MMLIVSITKFLIVIDSPRTCLDTHMIFTFINEFFSQCFIQSPTLPKRATDVFAQKNFPNLKDTFNFEICYRDD